MDNDDYEVGYENGTAAAEAIVKNYHFMVAAGQITPSHYEKKGFIEAFKNTIGQWNAE